MCLIRKFRYPSIEVTVAILGKAVLLCLSVMGFLSGTCATLLIRISAAKTWCRPKLFRNGFVTVSFCYRPPGADPSDFLDELCGLACAGHCLALRDFNTPQVEWTETRYLPRLDRFSKEFLEVGTELASHQHARRPTRIFTSQESTINLVLSPRSSDVEFIGHLPFLGSSDLSIPMAPGCSAPSTIAPSTRNL